MRPTQEELEERNILKSKLFFFLHNIIIEIKFFINKLNFRTNSCGRKKIKRRKETHVIKKIKF